MSTHDWDKSNGCPRTHLSQFCTVHTEQDGQTWVMHALEDGLEDYDFTLDNPEALLLARAILEANGFTMQAAALPSERELYAPDFTDAPTSRESQSAERRMS